MTITDVIALIALSLLGLIFWIIALGISQNTKTMREALSKPPAGVWAHIQGSIVALIAVAMVFVPWLLMVISVARRVIA
jgi:amino acid transporter